MRSKLLIMSTAALLAGTLAAAGQSIQPGGAQEKGQQGSSQGVKSNEAQQDKLKSQTQGQAQDKKGQAQDKKGQTQGQAQGEQDKLKGQAQGQQDKPKGQAQGEQDKPKAQTQGQAPRDQDKLKIQTQGDQDKAKSQTQGQAPRDQDRQGQTQRDQQGQRPGQNQGQIQRDQERVQGGREGERGGNVTVTFTTEQRTRIRETVFKEKNAPRVSKAEFSIREGSVVPRTVKIIEVPDLIVEVHPEWRGFKYFIVNSELVIVEPDTLRIVAVIDV
jgi:hypothetical protein